MNAVSIRQPYASHIASGKKTLEVRSWYTNHRGPLLICASKRKYGDLPIGAAVCVVDVTDCRPMRRRDASGAMCPYQRRMYVWVLKNPRPLKRFLHVRGQLRLFRVQIPPDITA